MVRGHQEPLERTGPKSRARWNQEWHGVCVWRKASFILNSTELGNEIYKLQVPCGKSKFHKVHPSLQVHSNKSKIPFEALRRELKIKKLRFKRVWPCDLGRRHVGMDQTNDREIERLRGRKGYSSKGDN
ncbi:hypothetical protein RJT34_27321 [Clitoria ternatea]|uniref:Uncharacterized protein n=1 Tax=Clitoria ternatea TaxID=43366 RepID=A0AAN9FGE6_CLITE